MTHLLLLAASFAQAQPSPPPLKQITAWVDPVTQAPPLTEYKLFHSKLANTDWSYLVYTPPDYATATQRRYPALYWLHGGGGNQRGGAKFIQLLDSAIRRGVAPPMIVFLLNGLGESCWADSKDGKLPVESIIVKEMIPEVDRTYRTLPRREARAVEGMSMGGFGALHLGFGNNAVFGVVSALAPGLVSEKDEPMKLPPAAFEHVFSRDMEHFKANTAWAAAEKNAAALASNTRIRVVVGDADTWIYGRSQDYHALLDRLRVKHDFVVVPKAKHSYAELYDGLGDSAFAFYRQAFAFGPRPPMAGQAKPMPPSPEERKRRFDEYAKLHPPRESTGMIALTDLGKGDYKGEMGGLYPGGKNVPPAAHRKAGIKLSADIVPRDAEGKPAADGKIVLLCLGFSNPNLEYQAFIEAVRGDAGVNPRLVAVNGCVGSQAAATIADPSSNYWQVVNQRLAAAGVTAKQVQAAWMKEVNPSPSREFPAESKKLYADWLGGLHNAADKFPNLKLAYLSSRIYAGYAASGGSPEPWAYETGFAVKWLVADQLGGKAELNYNAAKGAVKAPWIAWGPYLWADGVKGRKDGLVFQREDLIDDGLHPSATGKAKVVQLMMDFFKGDPTSKPWFVKR